MSEEDNEPLTPKQLITGYRQRQKHPIDNEKTEYSDIIALTRRERLRRDLLATWWENFNKEYVADLEKFHCPAPGRTKQVQLGQVVLIHDDAAKRSKWKTGRISKLLPGSDGKVRRVALQIADKMRGKGSTTIFRYIQCLYPLELHAGQIDPDHTDVRPFTEQNTGSASDSELDDGPTREVLENPGCEPETSGRPEGPSAN
ncbi:hypothetical protein GHT06_017161 [Daphnia sinensis]|uniref:DUF5641 domain-containing protein n=1 Tax=Daphnia sinensis TaxID=1820382 RepID=A0AAD5L7W3_9CRUS|nr:hypothetical protein GHT06_017161 [Daphnia sinensis]